MFFHNQFERDPNALGARRREFPRRDHCRDTNDVDFTKDIAKSFVDSWSEFGPLATERVGNDGFPY